MSRIAVVQPISANPSTVWALIGNPAEFANWHPAVISSKTSDGSRTCVLPDGAEIQERILSHDDGAMRYSYAITESPLPLKDYRSTLSVEAADGGCVVRWSADFEALGPVDEVEGMIRGLYEAGLAAACNTLEA
jgi:hypothetical protein